MKKCIVDFCESIEITEAQFRGDDKIGGSVFECGLDDKGYCPRCQAIRLIVSDVPEDDGKAIIGFKGERI